MDEWSYKTFAPLALRPGDIFSRFHTGRSLFWPRTEKGICRSSRSVRATGTASATAVARTPWPPTSPSSPRPTARTRPWVLRIRKRTHIRRSSTGPRAARPTAARTSCRSATSRPWCTLTAATSGRPTDWGRPRGDRAYASWNHWTWRGPAWCDGRRSRRTSSRDAVTAHGLDTPGTGEGAGRMACPSAQAPMVNPIPPYISPKRLERLEEFADASRLRAVLYPPKPPPLRRRTRSRQFPSGRSNPWPPTRRQHRRQQR